MQLLRLFVYIIYIVFNNTNNIYFYAFNFQKFKQNFLFEYELGIEMINDPSIFFLKF